MSPQQKPVSPERTAIAPYNFVELPEQVVAAEAVPDQDQYHAERCTGQIDCTLTAESPLYVRCGLTAEQLRAEKEAKDLPDFFYVDPHTKLPVIPGSSLRGMLRAMVEIVSFSKIERVTDQQRYFFRAVAAKRDDPLAQPYKQQLQNVYAGYLVQQGTAWYIRPARQIGLESYIKVRENDLPASLGIRRFHAPDYKPQYVDVSFTTRQTPKGRTVVDRIDKPGVHPYRGVVVTSGNMLETGKTGAGRSPRKNHAVILEPETQANLLPLDERAVEDYRASLTDFQKQEPFDAKMGMLKHGRPVFYCEPKRGTPVIFFGQSPNFRVPYRFINAQRAASPADFVPEKLTSDALTDLAEAIFGYVRREKQADDRPSACAGRITVSDAGLCSAGNVWLREDETPITPRILAGPKPTTFQHYLVQPNPNDKSRLKHYAGTPGETVIRGHKLYWHQREVGLNEIEDQEFMQKPEAERRNDTQHTQFKPVRPGTQFRFTVHFENLSRVELGALLWVLHIAGQDEYRLKLGMGKPLGMGAVKLEHTVMLSDRAQRYRTLFTDRQWATGSAPMTAALQQECTRQFEQYILDRLNLTEQHLPAVPRIQALLTLLRWPGPDPRVTRYMEIERDTQKEYISAARPRGNKVNEYGERPVLPTPPDVAACSPDDLLRSAGNDHRRPAAQVQSGQSRQTGSPAPSAQRHSRGAEPSPSKQSGPVAPPSQPAVPTVGTVFTGKVLNRDESAVLIAVPGFSEDTAIGVIHVEEDTPNYRAGKDSARVKVIHVRNARGRTVLELKPVKKGSQP